MKKLISSAVLAAAFALPTAANASVTINFGSTTAVPANNDFAIQLSGLGLTQYASSGASMILSGPSVITFEFLGSESGFNDRIDAGSVSYTEFTSFVNNFGSPLLLGSDTFGAGSLAGLITFSAVGGATATVGDAGFGIFLGPNAVSGASYNEFYLGYDDQIKNIDDNHDDMIIRARITPAVPEPGTWAMMLIGFGAVGYSLRFRRRTPRLSQLA